VQGGRKVIVNRATGIVEYYDLDADPREQVNLADGAPAEFADLHCRLLSWMADRLSD
jgi:hypothetical protein